MQIVCHETKLLDLTLLMVTRAFLSVYTGSTSERNVITTIEPQ